MGYELKCVQPIKPFEQLAVLPLKLCFTSKDSDGVNEIASRLALEKKKGSASFFQPFMDVSILLLLSVALSIKH